MSRIITLTLVRSVIAGFYGNGGERKKELERLGYNYKEVQKAVNEYLETGYSPLIYRNSAKNALRETLRTNESGKNLIKSFESCKLTAYKDSTGTWTIGWGHTGTVDGKMIVSGMTITQEKADSLFDSDLVKFENIVNAYNSKYHFTSNEFSALVSFAYNVGSIKQLTANGTRSKKAVADAMLKYVYSKGIKLNGLVRRRKKERELFLSDSDESV